MASTHRPLAHPVFAQLLASIREPLTFNAYALMVSTGVSSGLGLVYWMLVARFYDAHTAGLNAAGISAMLFFANLSQLNCTSALVRYLPKAGHFSGLFVSYTYVISITVATILSLIFLIGVYAVIPSLSYLLSDPWITLWFMMGVISWCVFSLQDSVLIGLRKTVWVPIENILYSMVKIILLMSFAAPFAEQGILASWTIPTLITLIPVNWLIFNRFIPAHLQETAKQTESIQTREIVEFVAGNFIGSLFIIASNRLTPVIVSLFATASATAYFFLPWTITSSVKLMINNMGLSLTVEGVHNQEKMRIYARRFLRNIAWIIIPSVLLIIALGPPLLRFSGADYAREGTVALWLLTLSIIPNMFTALHVSIARVQKQARLVAATQASIFLVGAALSCLLIPYLGITGVGLALLISESSVAAYIVVTRLVPLLR